MSRRDTCRADLAPWSTLQRATATSVAAGAASALVVLTCLAALPLTAQDTQRDLYLVVGPETKKLALVIGNDKYADAPLGNAVNDAKGLGAALQDLGFRTQVITDGSLRAMERAIDEFVGKLGKEDVAVFFFAGHGIQIEGENYLLPVDFQAKDEADVKYAASSASRLHERVEAANPRLSILVFDACRNNPFRRSRSVSQGLAGMNTGKGSFIAFATAPGSTASDNAAGRNGLFTSTLIETLRQPGLTLDQIFNRVREKVFAASGERQLPWVSSSVIGKFYFRPPAPVSDQTAAPAPPRPAGEITPAARQAAANMYGDGRRLLDARRFADAAPMLERATLIDPSNADAFRDLGIVRGHLGQYQASVQSLTEAIRLKPDSYDAYLNRGIAYGELGQYQLAVDDLTRAIGLKPDAWAPYWQRGVARGRLGDKAGSEADLAKARQLRGR